jgi:hypothetical protein
MNTQRNYLCGLGLCALLAGCGGGDSGENSKQIFNISGVWNGTITNRAGIDNGAIKITLSQGVGSIQASLRGTWSTQQSSGDIYSGLIYDTGSADMSFSRNDGNLCFYKATLVVESANKIYGDYVPYSGCQPGDGGTLNLTR